MAGRTQREYLIVALAAISDEARAREIVDALDEYLSEDPTDRAPMRLDLRPDPTIATKERDAAVARAERATQELRLAIGALEQVIERLKTGAPTGGLADDVEIAQESAT
jgi:hypothetical protein